MGQVDVTGPDALPFLQYVTTNDVSSSEPGEAQYSLLTNEQGGVVDDIIIYREPDGDGYMVVVNASQSGQGCRLDASEHARARADLDVTVRISPTKLG